LQINEEVLNLIRDSNIDLFDDVKVQAKSDDSKRSQNFKNAYPEAALAAFSVWSKGKLSSDPSLKQWLDLLTLYPDRIDLSILRQKVLDTLLECGICPGGSSSEVLQYEGEGSKSEKKSWYTCYDWNDNKIFDLLRSKKLI